ncbi:Conserved oligomeric Golgi complex subunit 2, partial [Mortierella alpina]
MTSDMLRKMYKARPPPLPPHLDDDYDEQAEESLDQFSSSLSFQSPTPAVHPSKLSLPAGTSLSSRYAPLNWSAYFDEKRSVVVPAESESEAEITFTVYETRGKPGAPAFVMHHGAGLCALSFALTAREIRKICGKDASILSYDVRGHGETVSGDENNMSLDRLARDLRNVVHAVYGEQPPDIVLVGHSMGGAVVSEAASRGMIPNLIGVAVLDIVEGVAIETLANMNGWLERRPNVFRSLDKVVQWGIKSGTVRNVESARVSCPPLVVPSKDSTPKNASFVWRTDLAASEQYWKEWFTGLTQKFLSSRAGKLLILAGTDRLDKDMTIAQMQGKFQLLVFPNSGHAVQEDEPERMARELVAFWKRNERLMVASSTGAVDTKNSMGTDHQDHQSNIDAAGVNGSTNLSHSRKPSHLSIDSTGANNAFLHTLNAQLQVAANHRQHQQQDAALSENDFPLSIGIDRAALTAPDFDTDEFLSARRHLPLEELKSQLIAHMKELKTELIELINSDYADFINLSTNLNGVDRMMEELRKPLDRMKGDAIAVKSNLQSVVESLEQKLGHRAEIREKKACLQLLLNISESVAKVEGLLQISGGSDASAGLREGSESVSKRLERVAIEYNQMQYLVSKGANLPFVTNIDWRLVRIKETMSENLSTVLRACISPQNQAAGDAAANKESLTQCLRTYALIDQTTEAEKVIAEDLLAPFVNKTITKSALLEHNNVDRSSQSYERPLVIMYRNVLTFIDNHCSALISVTQKDLKGTNFDIPVNCIWGVVSQAILENIPKIMVTGIADEFHRNYMDTMGFVSQIEQLCGTRRSLARLRSLASYQTFMRRWNLQAYFQLRFGDIATSIENALQMSVDASPRSPTADVHLPASTAVLRAIERCWSDDVYIYGIAHHLWKFTLQIMARYSIWITNLTRDLDPSKEKSIQSRSSSPAPGSRQQGRSTPVPGAAGVAGNASFRPNAPGAKTPLEEMMLQQLSMVINDINHVTAQINQLLERQIRPKMPPSMADEPVLIESFEHSLQAIQQDVPTVQQRIVALIAKHCIDTLANVKTITSRYGEGPPQEPSQFVPLILAPLSKYLAGPGAVLNEQVRRDWTLQVVTETTNRYSFILAEKLLESKISEERMNKMKAVGAKSRAGGLLSRATLPNAFSSASGTDTGANMSKDDMLRLQCVLDVRCYKSE